MSFYIAKWSSTFYSVKYKNVRSLNFKADFLKMLCFQVRQFYQIRVLHLLPQKAPKLACFVLYLEIINIFLKNNIYIL